MKKVYLIPFLLVAGLASCGGSKSSTSSLAEQALDAFPILLDFNTGKEIYASDGLTAKYYDSFLGLKNLHWQDQDFSLTWEALPADKWNISNYKGDENRTKFRPTYGDTSYEATLKLTIATEDGKDKAEAEWKFTTATHTAPDLSSYTYMAIQDLQETYNATPGSIPSKVYTYGYLTSSMEESETHIYSGVYMGDGDYGLMLYSGNLSKLWDASGFAYGDLIMIAGTTSPYNGLLEVKPDFMEFADKEDPKAVGIVDPYYIQGDEYAWSMSGDNNIGVHQSALIEFKGLAYKSGKVDSLNSHATITFTHEGTDIDVYCNYHLGTAAMTEIQAFIAELSAGDVVNVRGVISVYNKPQIVPVFGGNSFSK